MPYDVSELNKPFRVGRGNEKSIRFSRKQVGELPTRGALELLALVVIERVGAARIVEVRLSVTVVVAAVVAGA